MPWRSDHWRGNAAGGGRELFVAPVRGEAQRERERRRTMVDLMKILITSHKWRPKTKVGFGSLEFRDVGS